MRVALFAPHYAEYATRMAIELARSNHVLLLLDKQNRKNELEPPLFAGAKRVLKLFEFRTDTRIHRRLSRVTVVLRIMLFRPDVLHVQEQPDQLTAIATSILRKFFPIVLTVHDPKPHMGRDEAYALRWDKYRQRIRLSARLYHVHGRYCAGLMKISGSAQRPIVETLHGAILGAEPSQLQPSSSGRVLFFGRMEEYKGLDILLAAARDLRDRGIRLELILAGRGPELNRLLPDIEKMDYVTIINRYLTPSEAVGEFQKAGVVVIPYIEATQSGVVAAAFANGRPVVASHVGGLVDVIQDGFNGIFVPPGSVKDLSEALGRILTDDALRTQLTKGARETGQTTLSWQSIVEKLSEAYRVLVKQRSATAG